MSEEREGKRERERAQRLPPIDFCALAVNSRVLLLYATPSPPSSYLASVIDYLIPIDRDPVHPITDHLPPPCPTLILDRFCTASINRREIDIPIPPPPITFRLFRDTRFRAFELIGCGFLAKFDSFKIRR